MASNVPAAVATGVTLMPPIPGPLTAEKTDWCVPSGGVNASGEVGPWLHAVARTATAREVTAVVRFMITSVMAPMCARVARLKMDAASSADPRRVLRQVSGRGQLGG